MMFSKIQEVFRWRQLVASLVAKELKTKYRSASGGFAWMFVMPVVQMLIFSFIFGILFKVKIENYPLFLLCGLLAWSFLKSSLDASANSILKDSNLIKKTYFPREVLPLSSVFTNLVNFLFALLILFVFSLFNKIPVFAAIAWLPIVICLHIMLIIGISLILAGLNAIYRETKFIIEILLLVWFYMTPIVYSLDMVSKILPKGLFILYSLNPMLGITSGYQQIFVNGLRPDLGLLLISGYVSILVFLAGWVIFSRCEDLFVDMV